MENIFKILGIIIVVLGILNAILSSVTKTVLRKNGFEVTSIIAQFSDLKKLYQLSKKEKNYKVLFYAYLLSTLLFFSIVIIIIVLITKFY